MHPIQKFNIFCYQNYQHFFFFLHDMLILKQIVSETQNDIKILEGPTLIDWSKCAKYCFDQ